MENYKLYIKNNIQKRRQELKLNVYVLPYMVVTLDTAHFERSLLNADASLNAVQIIQWQDYNNGKQETKNKNTKKEEENWK